MCTQLCKACKEYTMGQGKGRVDKYSNRTSEFRKSDLEKSEP